MQRHQIRACVGESVPVEKVSSIHGFGNKGERAEHWHMAAHARTALDDVIARAHLLFKRQSSGGGMPKKRAKMEWMENFHGPVDAKLACEACIFFYDRACVSVSVRACGHERNQK